MRASAPAPLALRLVHAAIFSALGAVAIASSRDEWRHLLRAWSKPVHTGAPPNAILLIASILGVLGLAFLVVALMRRRSAPLAASIAVLVGCVFALSFRGAPDPLRTPSVANAALKGCAQSLRDTAARQLNETGDVPLPEAWPGLIPCPHLVRDRLFRPQSPQLVWLAEASLPEPLLAGTFAVFRSADAAHFALHPVGWSDKGDAESLTNARGEPLWLRATFDPRAGAAGMP